MQQNRTAAVEQLRRQQPKRALAKARAAGPRLKSALIGIDPAEIARIDDQLERERRILEGRVFGDELDGEIAPELTKDRVRQIGKRAARLMAELAAVHPRFQVMADSLAAVPPPARPTGPTPVNLVAEVSPDQSLRSAKRATGANRTPSPASLAA